jgi:transposase-like protein
MVKVLSEERRRQMILEVLRPGASVKEVAERYGINSNTLYEHVNRVVRDTIRSRQGPERYFP